LSAASSAAPFITLYFRISGKLGALFWLLFWACKKVTRHKGETEVLKNKIKTSHPISPSSAAVWLALAWPYYWRKKKTLTFSAGSFEILNAIAGMESMGECLQAIETIHVSDRGHFGGTQINAQEHKVDALGYVVENHHLGQALLAAIDKTHVHCITATVKKAEPVINGVNVFLDSNDKQSTIKTDCLIVADGAQSPLRRQLGIDHRLKPYPQVAMIANVALQKNHQGIAYERFTNEGPIALLPLKDYRQQHRAALVWTLPKEQQAQYEQADERTIIDTLQQRFGYRAGLIDAIGERHFYPLELVEAKEQVRSNVVILGNAAHFLHPVAGQGFNLALRDCQQLSKVLIDALHRPNVPIGSLQTLNAYLERQRFDQQKTIGITDQLVNIFSTEHLGLSVLRQLGLIGLAAAPAAKHSFAKLMMGHSHV